MAEYRQKYEDYEIVPQVLDSAPPETMSVEWKESWKKCYPGDEMKPTEVKTKPILDWRAFDDRLYAAIFVHLGSTSEPTQELNWQVFNAAGDDLQQGRVHAEYIASGPQKDTGLHRYLYLAYQQPSNESITPKGPYRPHSLEGRTPFNIREFAKEYGLGDPVAGNFYVAKYDDYVPTFYQELSGHGGLLGLS